MTTRRILATSGGFPVTDRWNVRRVGPMVRRALELTGKERPRVCFVHTASGDDRNYLTVSYEAMSSLSCEVTHLDLFPQPNADVEERICGSDLVWVGGGSVANLLALWRLHGVDEAMRAKEEGKEKVILFSWSGHGLLDLGAYEKFFTGNLKDYEMTDDDICQSKKVFENFPKPELLKSR